MNWQLACRQPHAEALDVSQETKATQEMYGLHHDETREYGTRCLIARRLVERGVRFVQIFHSGQPWDNHSHIRTTLPAICRRTDQPVCSSREGPEAERPAGFNDCALGGEIGRLPVTQEHGNPDAAGRDHNGQDSASGWQAGVSKVE